MYSEEPAAPPTLRLNTLILMVGGANVQIHVSTPVFSEMRISRYLHRLQVSGLFVILKVKNTV